MSTEAIPKPDVADVIGVIRYTGQLRYANSILAVQSCRLVREHAAPVLDQAAESLGVMIVGVRDPRLAEAARLAHQLVAQARELVDLIDRATTELEERIERNEQLRQKLQQAVTNG
jgi:hypothetical protein